MGAGAIAGIVVGSLAGVIIIVIIVVKNRGKISYKQLVDGGLTF